MTITTPDAQLVAGHLAGDPAALAGIYDRFADSLHDTAAAMLNSRDDAADVLQDVILIAAQKMGQLRDPDRLKPWLFAILRNEVYRRTKQRKRTVATDFSNDDLAAASGFDMTDDREVDSDSEAAESAELAELVRGAARGLDERDQLVLELSVRQGLEGQDLADALGVSTNQSYTLVHRMRERVEKSLGALAVAKAGRKDCDQLDSMLAKWDGEFTVLIRKRVARHIENCMTCAESKRKVAPLALFAGAPVLAAPAALRDRVLDLANIQAAALGGGGAPSAPYVFTADGGFPRIVAAGRRIAGWIAPTAAASLLLVTAGAGFWWLDSGQQPDTFQSAVVTSSIALDDASTTTVAPAQTTAPTPPTTTPAASPTTPPSAPPSTAPPTTPPPTTAPPTTQTPVVAPPSTRPPPPTTGPPTPQPPPPPPSTTAPVVGVPPSTSPPAPTTTASPTPGQLVGSSGTIDLGSGTAAAPFTLSNPGDLPVNWSRSGGAPFVLSQTAGTLLGGQSTTITVSLDRSNLSEGTQSTAAIAFTGDGGQFVGLDVSAGVERPPSFAGTDSSNSFCSSSVEFSINATINDESPPINVSFVVNGPSSSGLSGSGSMNPSGATGSSSYFGFTSINYTNSVAASGSYGWTITATDSRGNTSSTSGSVTITC